MDCGGGTAESFTRGSGGRAGQGVKNEGDGDREDHKRGSRGRARSGEAPESTAVLFLRNNDYVDENCKETEERTQLQGESQSDQAHQTL